MRAEDEPLNDLVCFNLYVGWRAVQAFYKPYFSDGMNPQRMYVLMMCDVGRDVTVSAVAAGLEIDLPAVSGILDRMEQDGLIVRKRTPENRREVRVRLTRTGKATRDAHARKLAEADALLLRHVAAKDIPAVRRLVTGLRAALHDRDADRPDEG